MHPVATSCVGRQRPALKLAVEVNHIVVPAMDQRASAELLAHVLGLGVRDYDSGHLVRVCSNDGLTIDFSQPQTSVRDLQCAFLLTGAEFDSALARMRAGRINFHAAFDGKGGGELNHQHGARGFYLTDPDGHLYEMVEQPGAPAPEGRIKAVAIKCFLR